MDGSSDTSRSGAPQGLLDELPPGIAWLCGPQPRPPGGASADAAQAPAGWPALRPGQVVTWLPDGRWVAASDEDLAAHEAEPEVGVDLGADRGRQRGPDPGGDRGRDGGGLKGGRARAVLRREGTELGEAARRRGRRRVALARVGARLAGWPRRVVVGVLLVAAAVLALRPQAAQAPAVTAATDHVVVAARDLAAGTELAAGDLRVVSMPVEIVPAGSSRRAAALIGRVAAGAIRRGEALTDARVVGPGLAAGLGPDETAVPVRIADPDAAALVRIGDRVDVLGTPVAPDGTQATAGETVAVASAVRVLAVLPSREPADGVVLVVATGQAAARTLAGAAVRHRLTVNVRPP